MGRPPTNDDATRERLIRAATSLMRDRQWDQLSVRQIAAEAGASTTSIYTLLGGRDQLIAAVRRHALALLHEVLIAVPRTRDPVADLLGMAAAYRSWGIGERYLYRAIFGGAVTYTPRGAPQDRDPAAPLVSAINRIRGPGHSVEEANRIAVAIWAELHGLVTLEIDGTLPAASIDTVLPQAIRSLVTGWPFAD
ncbi:TetR/AcrR family transcriptional regulator [Amycolatopsis pigmentata]|uniref:TetR/AcrR family transcriptional regulator n=1 Tax=Amycolatopsis pigmentata TaxID=450801 RepID=A0ABW5G1I9_9PSEU